jgi:hypothetical protein
MNILTLVCGIVGIALFVAFLGFMLWWVKALPLIVIVAVCTALLVQDFVQTLRFGENGSRPGS